VPRKGSFRVIPFEAALPPAVSYFLSSSSAAAPRPNGNRVSMNVLADTREAIDLRTSAEQIHDGRERVNAILVIVDRAVARSTINIDHRALFA
jgi:hypothetical protein